MGIKKKQYMSPDMKLLRWSVLTSSPLDSVFDPGRDDIYELT